MKNKITLLLLLASSLAFAVTPTPTKITTDQLMLGNSTTSVDKSIRFNKGNVSTDAQIISSATTFDLQLRANSCTIGKNAASDKTLIFDIAAGATNPKIEVNAVDSDMRMRVDTFKVGRGTANNKIFEFDIGAGSTNPRIRWNNTASTIQFANDGTAFTDIGSGSSSGGGIESLIQKLDAEHSGVETSPMENSVGLSGAASPASQAYFGNLLTNYISGASVIEIAWNPVFWNNSDKNFDTTTNITIQGAATGLTTSATVRTGAASVSFDKDATGTRAAIRYTRASQDLSLGSNTQVKFYLNMASVSDLSSVEMKICSDTASNCRAFTTSNDCAGSPVATGWNLMCFNVGTGGVVSGAGWTSSELSILQEIAVNTGSAATTYSAILVDSLMHSLSSPDLLGFTGQQLSIVDDTNRNEFLIDSANTSQDGRLTLGASIAQNYSGGGSGTTHAIVKRSFLLASGNVIGFDEVSGYTNAVLKNQEIRVSRNLRNSISGNFKVSADVNTPQTYPVVAVGGSSIDLTDPSNTTANLVNTDVLDIFRTIKIDGKKDFVYRTSLTITGSSFSAGVTTVNCTPGATAVGDYAVKRHITASASVVSEAVNESYSALTLDVGSAGVQMFDTGLSYPNESSIAGHYPLAGSQPNINKKGTLADLTVNGTINTLDSFLNGFFSASGWSTVNYYSLSTAEAAPFDPSVNLQQFSWWFNDTTGFTGTDRRMISRSTSATENPGLGFRLGSGANKIEIRQDGSTYPQSGSYTVGQWNHVFCSVNFGVIKCYLNGVLAVTGGANTNFENVGLFIGRWGYGPSNNTEAAQFVKMSDLVIWIGGSLLSTDQIAQIYNNSNYRPLGFNPGTRYNYTASALTGQKMSVKGLLTRITDAVKPFFTKIGIMKQ